MAGDKGKQVDKGKQIDKGKKKKSSATPSSKRPKISGYDDGRFRSQEAEDRFLKWYLPKKIISEKQILWDQFPEDSPIKKLIIQRQWQTLVTFAEPSSSSILKEFLANVNRDTVEDNRVSWVRGVQVPFDYYAIEDFLGTSHNIHEHCRFAVIFNLMQPIPGTSKSVYRNDMPQTADELRHGITSRFTAWKTKTGSDWVPEKLRRQDLTGEAEFWHQFVNHTIIPSTNLSDVNVERAALLFVLMRDMNLNISRALSDRIIHMIQDGNGRSHLAHSSLILHLCRRAGVVIPDDEPLDVPVATPMTPRTFADSQKNAMKEQLLRASEMTPEEMDAQSPRGMPHEQEVHVEILAHASPPQAVHSPSPPPQADTFTQNPPHHREPLFEDSSSYLHLQAQVRMLLIQGAYLTRMVEDICRHLSIDTSTYQPQYPSAPLALPPPESHLSLKAYAADPPEPPVAPDADPMTEE